MIDNDGSVYRATCKQGGVLGNIETGFTLKDDPKNMQNSGVTVPQI